MKTIALNTGAQIPVLGLGTFEISPGDIRAAVKCAVDAGYRHIDCALLYGNEREIGAALAESFKENKVKRTDVFITKMGYTYHRKDLVRKAIEMTLADLLLDYLDLYLIHWPVSLKEDGEHYPMEDGKIQHSDADWVDTWKVCCKRLFQSLAIERIKRRARVIHVRRSTANSEQIQRIMDVCRIKPAMQQIEVQPMFNRQQMIDFCHSKGIDVTAFSPLGAPGRPDPKPTDPKPLEDPRVASIAAKHVKSAAQVLLRYPIQRGIAVVKSAGEDRIKENLNVFDFQLSEEDMTTLNGMHSAQRILYGQILKESKNLSLRDSGSLLKILRLGPRNLDAY